MSARIFGHYCPTESIGLFALEAAGMAAGLAAVLAASLAAPVGILRSEIVAAVGVALAFEVSLYAWDLHDVRTATQDRRHGGRLLRALGGASLLLGLGCWAWPAGLPPKLVLPAAALAALPALVARWSYLAWLHAPTKIVVLGEGLRAAAVRRAIDRNGSGRFVVAVERCAVGELGRVIAASGVKVVVVASEDPRALPAEPLLAARFGGVRVLEAAQFVERLERRIALDLARPLDLALAEGPLRTPAGLAMKRTFDVAAACVLLALAGPLMILAAIAVRASSRGPVFYRQERLGRDGKPYTLVKFRTMRTDAEEASGPVWAQERDPRVTSVGAFLRRSRLDELPQLFNVLGGSMSLVGPRPERAFFAKHLREHIPLFDLRLAAKPGVTGWAQLRYPYGASIEDARAKLEFDLYYLENWSPFLDLVIAFHTAKHVLLGRGAR